MYFSAREILVSIIIVVIVLIVVIYFYTKNNAHKFEGYWRCENTGNIIKMMARSRDKLFIYDKDREIPCQLLGMNDIAFGSNVGNINFDNRRITWDNGNVWVVQGIR